MFLTAVIFMLGACTQETIANRGFSLPEGDAKQGQLMFIEFNCISCHTVADTDLSDEEWRLDGPRELSVQIGGEKSRVQSYGDLVTSIINPSHRISKGYPMEEVTVNGESKMVNYNNIMRVADLVDIVAFLRPKYTLREIPATTYPIFMYQ
jgi:mono/diheme cytochrome c family protein